MNKFHLNNNGDPGVCSARPGHCPFGNESNHFESKENAREAYEKQQSINNVDFKLSEIEKTVKNFMKINVKFSDVFFDPEIADGLCCEVSEFLHVYYKKQNIESKIVDLRNDDKVPHTVLKIGDYFIDLTSRQFDPTVEVPLITHEKNLIKKWKIVNEYTINENELSNDLYNFITK